MRSRFSVISFFVFFVIFISCTKYEEGPLISLRSRKARISNTWVIQSVTEVSTGHVTYSGYEGWELQISEDGQYKKNILYNGNQTIYEGGWEFVSADVVEFQYLENQEEIIEQFKIIRLANKELWLRDHLEEVHYMPK